jgi:hypothetical protein
MIKLIDLLLEARQVGPLYHFTGVRGLELIMDTNMFRASPAYVSGDPSDRVSFTRNKNYYWNIIRIGVDGDKLSTKYKITPYSYQQGAKGELDQSEEVVERDISNAKSYITDVTYILDKHKNYEHKVPISYLQQLYPSIKFSYKGMELSPEEAAKQFKFPTKMPKGSESGLYDTKISYDEMSSLKGKLMFVYYHLTYGSNKLTNKEYSNELNTLLSNYKIDKNNQKMGVERSNSEDLLNDMIAFGKKHGINTTKDFYGDLMVGDLEMYRDEEDDY